VANDLSTLNSKLATALRDTGNKTWASAERDDLLNWACARTYPRVAKRVQEDVSLTDDVDHYTLTDVAEIDSIDWLDSDGKIVQSIPGGAWRWEGDGFSIGGTLRVADEYSITDWSFRVLGWAPYDLTTNLPPDIVVPWILAMARAEAGRREIDRRLQSGNWQSVNQVQNVSVNELVLLVNESDAEAERLRGHVRVWRRPRSAY
jgi:hypothetical protein